MPCSMLCSNTVFQCVPGSPSASTFKVERTRFHMWKCSDIRPSRGLQKLLQNVWTPVCSECFTHRAGRHCGDGRLRAGEECRSASEENSLQITEHFYSWPAHRASHQNWMEVAAFIYWDTVYGRLRAWALLKRKIFWVLNLILSSWRQIAV